MNIVTTYFLVRSLKNCINLAVNVQQLARRRQVEYLQCLWRNTAHPAVKEVHLLVEGRAAYEHLVTHVLQCGTSCRVIRDDLGVLQQPIFSAAQCRKIVPVLFNDVQGMPTYADLFAHTNKMLCNTMTMLCNADIYLHPQRPLLEPAQQLFRLSRRVSGKGETRLALALTRYESEAWHDGPLITDYRGSHDAFLFTPPVPVDLVSAVRHNQNCYQAENVVIYELQQHNYRVLNPCLDLAVIHQHATAIRQWLPPVTSGRYAKAVPMTLQQAIDSLCHPI